MASAKEIPHSSRPIGQHRLSMSTNTGSSLPLRTSHSRHHSHSVSAGSLNPSHRITRRKSVSTNGANVAAVAAAVGDSSLAVPISASSRRNTMSKNIGVKGLATPPSSLPSHRFSAMMTNRKSDKDESAIEDDRDEDMEDDEDDGFNKARMRRASEGQAIKDGKKSDLRCDKCGKGYKHSSCLTKHLWEHTPEWSITSKLLISKHQQVQLLEAASVLVAMNNDAPTPPDSAKDFSSDQDSDSPAASGSSALLDGLSSADTTPPPQAEPQSYSGSAFAGHRVKRYSSGGNYAHSYQSAASYQNSIPNGSAFGQYEGRPLSSGFTPGAQEDEAGLAAAVELLSCSFGTPRTGPVVLPADVPPVPPLPAQYIGQSAFSGSTLTPNIPQSSTSYVREESHRGRDVKMEENDSVADEEDYDSRSRGRSDEDDEGVFGRMEE